MNDKLNSYNWQEAFAAAGEGQLTKDDERPWYAEPNNSVDLRRAPDSPTPLDHFTREDVEHIDAFWESHPGDTTEWEGVVLGRLKDGRWFVVEGGCDYTGWDCQSDCTAFVGPDREHIITFGLDVRAKEKLGRA